MNWMVGDKYCVHIYNKHYELVKKCFVRSKEEAVEIHQRYTKKGYNAVIEENPEHWHLTQA